MQLCPSNSVDHVNAVLQDFEAQMPAEEEQPQPQSEDTSPGSSSQMEQAETGAQGQPGEVDGEPGVSSSHQLASFLDAGTKLYCLNADSVMSLQDPSDSQNAQSGGQMNAKGTGQKLEASMEEVKAGQEAKERQVICFCLVSVVLQPQGMCKVLVAEVFHILQHG